MKHEGSLRIRLLVGGAACIGLALIASWIFIVASFSVMIDNERSSDLQASFDRLVAEIDPEAEQPVEEGVLADPRYGTPLGGVYWQISDLDTGTQTRSRSLWDIDVSSLVQPQEGPRLTQYRTPDGLILLTLGQKIEVERADGPARRLFVLVAEERHSDDDPVVRFGTTLGLYLCILAVALIFASLAQISIGLRPLAVLENQIASIRRGEAERLAPANLQELHPITEQVNDLLDAQEASIRFARERAADLAHGLKTPLAVLGATAQRLVEGGDTAQGDVLRVLTEQMNARVDYHLKVARLRFRTRAQGAHAALSDVVLRLVAVLRKGTHAEHIKWTVELEDALEVDMDEHDLMELLGILLENASQWAHGSIVVRAARMRDVVLFSVDDDGDGLTNEKIVRLGERGVRLDERSKGEGIGLAIAFAIVRFNRASLRFERSSEGGLRVEARLPAATQPRGPGKRQA